MAKLDISTLSIDQLNELMVEAKNLAIKKRGENLKALVDDLLQKSKAMNVTNAAVIAEIRKRESGTETKKTKASGGGKKAPNPWKKDMVYCNPEDQTKEWKGGSPGKKPEWLLELIPESMTPADKTAKYLELIKK